MFLEELSAGDTNIAKSFRWHILVVHDFHFLAEIQYLRLLYLNKYRVLLFLLEITSNTAGDQGI